MKQRTIILALMLFLAAVIEAFWSSRHGLGFSVHYIAGAALWILLLCYFLFAGRGKKIREIKTRGIKTREQNK
jgi:hypothetical protein